MKAVFIILTICTVTCNPAFAGRRSIQYDSVAGYGLQHRRQPCRMPSFKFVSSGITPVEMYVSPGSTCDFHFESTSGDKGNFGILQSTLVKRPDNGMAIRSSVRRYGYRPNAGFRGDDSMSIMANYDRGGETNATTMQVSIHVGNF